MMPITDVQRIIHWRLAEAMVEGSSEFDFAPGHEWSIPSDLRDRLIEWCADLSAWDQEKRP